MHFFPSVALSTRGTSPPTPPAIGHRNGNLIPTGEDLLIWVGFTSSFFFFWKMLFGNQEGDAQLFRYKVKGREEGKVPSAIELHGVS